MFDLTANYYAFNDLNYTVIDILKRLSPSLPHAPALLDLALV